MSPRRITARLLLILPFLLLLLLVLSLAHFLPHQHHILKKSSKTKFRNIVGNGIGNQHLTATEGGTNDTFPLCPSVQPPRALEERHALDRALAEVRQIVEQTQGFFVRDWSLWLGWNNMKYIIETSLNQAQLLNRTLVLPSFVYLRSCDFPLEVCGAYAQQVDRTVSGSDEFLRYPEEERQAWRVPVSTMFRLPPSEAVITLSQFLALQGLSPSLERADGQFDTSYLLPGVGLLSIPNEEYDPASFLRLDRLPPQTEEERNESLREELDRMRSGTHLLAWNSVQDVVNRVLSLSPAPDPSSDETLIRIVQPYDLIPVYSYHLRASDLSKRLTAPYKAFVRRREARGWVEDYSLPGEEGEGEVVWLQGEVHNQRRPGSMWFHASEARDAYARLVLYTMRFPPSVDVVADRLAERMLTRTGGRMWMAAHMRRGDFTTFSWTQTPALEQHLQRIQNSLSRGRALLTSLSTTRWQDFHLPPVADVLPNLYWSSTDPPGEGDSFYLATDERSPSHLAKLRRAGAVLLPDLLTAEDRQLLGPQALFTDFLSLVEQAMQVRAAYWTGNTLTSVAGAVGNARAARGCEERTTAMDS
ncbi:hypothetical protein DACRYDRAFT_119543 [Dacryopinax primogenitus]|uniref:Uncharacterized protein n=1 Tax=Dacryopinax primogenitus (strain DJM 731) TaxID=1858805 RepID=M5FRA4_DACPD|nr:uncharacterized protein DACRYDRAFT_119543 [Dacryopinax primogenitus]EJT97464.1 hypothetical protein DACRYDRAFT_119543 [Dacryopinax primogenitus]